VVQAVDGVAADVGGVAGPTGPASSAARSSNRRPSGCVARPSRRSRHPRPGGDGPGPAVVGGCARDSFALPHVLPHQGPMLVATTCPACDQAHAWRVEDRAPPVGDQVGHFLVPTVRTCDDVVYICTNQRIFCSEACVTAWPDRSGRQRGYRMDLPTLWGLASGWYAGHLDHTWTVVTSAASRAPLPTTYAASDVRRMSDSPARSGGSRQSDRSRARTIGHRIDARICRGRLRPSCEPGGGAVVSGDPACAAAARRVLGRDRALTAGGFTVEIAGDGSERQVG
jgi:hypothetical protein